MSKKSNQNSARARRRSKGPNYVQLFRYVLDSPAYVSLSAKARAALIEIIRGYNGSNNGEITLSVRQLAERMNCDKDVANHALQELIVKGFIEPRIRGAFSFKFRRATVWRLNDRRCDVTGELSQAFLKWQAPEPTVRAVPQRGKNMPPWIEVGMSRRTWYRRGKPTVPDFPDTTVRDSRTPCQMARRHGPEFPDTMAQITVPKYRTHLYLPLL
jgi:DNA-binding transcriptional regulator YhcF (GntR family)